MVMKALSKAVTRFPIPTIVVLIIITASLAGAYVKIGAKEEASEQTFLPDTELVKANLEVGEEYGSVEPVQILVKSKDGNILTVDSLVEILEVEEELIKDPTINSTLMTPENPSESMISIADIVIMGNMTLEGKRQMLLMLNTLNPMLSGLSFDGFNYMLLSINSTISSYYLISVSDCSDDVKENATDILMGEIQLMNLSSQLNMTSDENASTGFTATIDNLTYILTSNSDTYVKKNATDMVVNQLELAGLMAQGGMDQSQMGDFTSGFEMLNFTLSNSSMSFSEKQAAVQGMTDILTMYIDGFDGSEALMEGINYSLASVGTVLNTTGNTSQASEILNSTIGDPDPYTGSGLQQNLTFMNQLNATLTQYMGIVTNFMFYPTPENTTQTIENTTSLINTLQMSGGSQTEINYLQNFNMTLTISQSDPTNSTLLSNAMAMAQQTLGIVGTQQQSVSQGIDTMNGLVYGLIDFRDYVILNSSLPLPAKEDAVSQFQASIQENITMLASLKTLTINLKGTLVDLVYILGSDSDDGTKNSAIDIMIGELQSMTASAQQTPPDENMTLIMENFKSTLTSLYNILDSNCDQTVKDYAVDMVVNEFQLMSIPTEAVANMEGFDISMFEGMSGSSMSMSLTTEDKTNYLTTNMTGNTIQQTIDDILNYDKTEGSDQINSTIQEINRIIGELDAIDNTLSSLVSTLEDIEENTSDTTTKSSIHGFASGFEENKTTMSYASIGLNGAVTGLGMTTILDSVIEGLSFSFPMMLSKDFSPDNGVYEAKATMMIVQLNASKLPGESEDDYDERFLSLERKMEDIVDEHDLTSTEMSVMGMALMEDEIMTVAFDSMKILLPLAFGFVIVILAIIYRNLLDMFSSLLALMFAVIWVYGFGVLLGFTFNPITIAIPVLLVGLGIDYGIHIVMRYREEAREGFTAKESAGKTIQSVGAALLLATATTVISFLSMLTSSMTVLQEFGILCAIGILASFVIMITFVPAVRQLADMRKEKKGKPIMKDVNQSGENEKISGWHAVKGSGVDVLNRFLGGGAVTAEHHPIPTIAVVVLITAASAYGALNLETEFDMMDFLPEDMDVAQDMMFMMNEFNVTLVDSVYILVKGDLTNPVVLDAINETINEMSDDDYVIKYGTVPQAESIISTMQKYGYAEMGTLEYNETFVMMYRNSDTDNDGLPEENITSIYDWLYENTDIDSLLRRSDGDDYDGTVIRIRVDTKDDTKIAELYDELKEDKAPLNQLVRDNTINQAIITGDPIMMYVIIKSLEESQMRSLVITIIVCAVMLTIVFWFLRKSIVLGLITTIPVVLVVVWTLGTMYLVGIGLNVLTISVSALTIGLGITYAIHITHRFLEDIARFEDIDEACRYSIRHTGTALFGAAITTICGFGLMVFSIMPPLQQFGGISALAILFSFLSAVFVLPTLLVMWAKRVKKKEKERGDEEVPQEEPEKEIKVEEEAEDEIEEEIEENKVDEEREEEENLEE